MDQAFRDVLAFQTAAGREIPEGGPGPPSSNDIWLSLNLIEEEWEETRDAMVDASAQLSFHGKVRDEKLAEVADGLADLIVTALAAAVQFGVDLPAVWKLVHASNMAKFGPGAWKDETGKVRKPPNWVPPDVLGLIKTQRPILETYREIKGA